MAWALAPVCKQDCFKEAKTIKTGPTFMIRYIAQRMGRAHRKTVCSSSSEGGQRYTPAEECRVSEEEHSLDVFKSLIWDSPSRSLFTFGQLSCFFLHT